MVKRLIGGGLAAAIGLLGLSVPAALAQPARLARPAAVLPGLHVMNLHAAYERALPTAKSGKPSGIVYALGHAPKAAHGAGTTSASGATVASGCSEPNCNLVYHGGPVQHDPKIYLLLWGPTWQTSASEQATAAYLDSFLKGLGAQPQDNWSTITAQYTDSTGFPGIHGSEYMGTFYDTSIPPTGVTPTKLGAEADAFAKTHHLTGDVNAQIVIATQSGTCPSGFGSGGTCPSGGQYCAWHTNSVNTGVTFTNLPYLLDAGSSCGENFVNSGSQGLYDGFSIVEGHEYAETITDPVPPVTVNNVTTGGGWIDTADKVSGGEIGDKCAWLNSGTGAAADVTLSTGTFAMQSLWNNAAGACTMSPTTDTLTVTSPGSQTMFAGNRVYLPVRAASSTRAKLEYYAAGLPGGLSINAATGLITGAPRTTGTGSATITADDTTGAVRAATFTWTVQPAPPKFRIKGYRSECVTDYRYLASPGTRVVINSCDTLLREKWIVGAKARSLQINGLCLTDPRWGRWGTKLVLEPCTGFTNQQWTLKANGEYTIAFHGLCMTDPRWSTKAGTQLILQSCRDWKNQRWTKA
ncbi:MAG: ricin-type beta-trefoil lectin domain protein [Actinomycetota bacterium]|nr:ricin-type beta-trefoil lectin domain protein [Actinomycetota bacterium]